MSDIYKLSRNFWDFAFEHTGKIKPIHVSIYFFAVEHCNRLGWKKEFGLPTSMVLEAISVKSYSVYKIAFDELVDLGFFEVVQYSKNQYSSNIIALKENSKANDKANTKALDKALTKHLTKQPLKQCESNPQSKLSIDRQIYNDTNIQLDDTSLRSEQFEKFWEFYGKHGAKKPAKQRFMKLTETEMEALRKHLPKYLDSTPDIKFRKHAERYLSSKLWENGDIENLSKPVEYWTNPFDYWNRDLTPEEWKRVPPDRVQGKKDNDIKRRIGI